jgi:hypothetical protein
MDQHMTMGVGHGAPGIERESGMGVKVTMNEPVAGVGRPAEPTTVSTPSQDLVRAAAREFNVSDKRGRILTIRKPPFLAQFQFVDMLGDASASNRVYFFMVSDVLFLAAIDGAPMVLPTSKLQLEAILQRLDEDGCAALREGVVKHFGQSDPEAQKETLKNS